jgi:hypothetical protein
MIIPVEHEDSEEGYRQVQISALARVPLECRNGYPTFLFPPTGSSQIERDISQAREKSGQPDVNMAHGRHTTEGSATQLVNLRYARYIVRKTRRRALAGGPQLFDTFGEAIDWWSYA